MQSLQSNLPSAEQERHSWGAIWAKSLSKSIQMYSLLCLMRCKYSVHGLRTLNTLSYTANNIKTQDYS
jgi:hypothetical protein